MPKPVTGKTALTLGSMLTLLSLISSPCPAQSKDQAAEQNQANAKAASDVSLTVYSTADPASFNPQRFISQQRRGYNANYVWRVPGFGVVKEVRPVKLDKGTQELAFTDVARFVDPTTVSFRDLEAPNATSVLEQQFRFDLANASKILQRMHGQRITVNGITGKLLSATQGRIVLKTKDGVRITGYNDEADLKLPKLPEGILTKPTLVWLLHSDKAGKRNVRTTYQTAGLTWRADYNLVLGPNDKKADLGAWVSLMNLSGASYDNAKLKLIAGDVRRVKSRNQPRGYAMAAARRERTAGQKTGFKEKSFYEYHLYTLPRRTTVRQNSTQQITLFPTARDVNVDKVFVYYGLPFPQHWSYPGSPRTNRRLGNKSNKKVDVYLRFKNTKENNLGMPLPAGKVRVYKRDQPTDNNGEVANGRPLEFVGEDLIDHTPRDEKLLIKTGQAFDIVGERTQTNFHYDRNDHWMTESFQIELRNHKKQDAKVLVRESLYRWSNWQITKHSDDFKKIDARTIHFPVTVPADGKKTVTYTVKYTW